MASVQRRKNNGSYYVSYRVNNRQKTKEFGKGEAAREEAHKFKAAIEDKQKRAKDSQNGTVPLEVKYLDDLAVIYFKADAVNGLKKWKKDWANLLNRHLLEELGQIPIDKLTQEFIVALVMKKFPKAKPVTHGNYLSYLKIMFNFGIERGYIKENPLRFWKKKKQVQRDFSMNLDTIKLLMEEAPPHLAFAIEIIANTGVRPGPSDLLSMQWKNVLWDQSAVRVWSEKTQSWRTIPAKPAFMDKLRAQKAVAKSEFLVEYRGKGVSGINQSFRRLCRKLGIPDSVELYDVRHWFCTTLLSKGVPVKTASQLMGHSSAKMTLDRYAHVIIGDADKAIAQLPDLD